MPAPANRPHDPLRRRDMQRWTAAEKAIADAIEAVELAGCDTRLTNAVSLLGQAQDAVADFVDGVGVEPTPGRYRDTDGAVGTLHGFDQFANCYTFTPDGHRPPAVIPDTQPKHLRDRRLGTKDVRRLVPVEPLSPAEAAAGIEWKTKHSVLAGGSDTHTISERLRELAVEAKRLPGAGQVAVVGIAPEEADGQFLCLDPSFEEQMAAIALDYLDGHEDDDVVVVARGVAPVGTFEALPDFDGW